MTGAVPHHAVPDFLRAVDLTVAPYAAEAALIRVAAVEGPATLSRPA